MSSQVLIAIVGLLLVVIGVLTVFLMQGSSARRTTEATDGVTARAEAEAAAAGHLVGNHTMTHPWLAWQSSARIRQELAGCNAILEDTLGVPIRYFRAPHGARRPAVLRIAHELGLTPGPVEHPPQGLGARRPRRDRSPHHPRHHTKSATKPRLQHRPPRRRTSRTRPTPPAHRRCDRATPEQIHPPHRSEVRHRQCLGAVKIEKLSLYKRGILSVAAAPKR